jgi:hypothetical protein
VDGSTKIVPARGGLDDARADEVVEFLSREGGMHEHAARSWLSEIVCLAVDDGTIVGVGTAHPTSIALIGGRPFWLYRSVLTAGFEDLWDEMFNVAFAELTQEFERDGAYVGLCVLVESQAEMRRRPEAVWPKTELMFVGYLDDGRQVRLRYFWGAEIAPGLPNSPSLEETRGHEYPLEDRYRIHPFGEVSPINAEDVIRFWEREGAMPEPDEARRRVDEVGLVAVDRDGSVAGVSTLYLARNAQLRMNLWHYRTFVGEAHRMSNLAAQLIFGSRDRLEERFVSGADTRAGGMLFELEHEGMKAYFNKALWLPADFTFISENEFGDHVRVHYFPGARVPLPGDAAPD